MGLELYNLDTTAQEADTVDHPFREDERAESCEEASSSSGDIASQEIIIKCLFHLKYLVQVECNTSCLFCVLEAAYHHHQAQ